MGSIFDHLVREISHEERQAMLAKLSKFSEITAEPMHLEDAQTDAPVVLEKEFAELPFLAKMRIIILCLFSNRDRNILTEQHLLHRLQRRVERAAPGLVDFRNKRVSPDLYHHVLKLRQEMNVFKLPIVRAMEEHRPDFYALLGKMENEDVQKRLEIETNPEYVFASMPGADFQKIKGEIEHALDDIFSSISLEQQRKMVVYTTIVARIQAIVQYPYERILSLFSPRPNGGVHSASLRDLAIPLLELGNVLDAFQMPPPPILLEVLFLFDLQYETNNEQVEAFLLDRMQRAAISLDFIRRMNSNIPWSPLLKAIAEDVRYTPIPGSGGEDWFRVFKQFWEERLGIQYRNWSDRKSLTEIVRNLISLWDIETIPMIPGYSTADFPENIRPRHYTSMAAAHCLFSQLFPQKIYDTLNLIMLQGKFYKRDNRREYEEVFRHLLKTPDKISQFVKKVRIDGEYGMRHAEIHHSADANEKYRNMVLELDRESQNILIPIIDNLRKLTNLLCGILDGEGGSYDTLSNVSEIGTQGHEALRRKLRRVLGIVDPSAENLSNLVDLEDKWPAN